MLEFGNEQLSDRKNNINFGLFLSCTGKIQVKLFRLSIFYILLTGKQSQ